jgi:hypothetical protein
MLDVQGARGSIKSLPPKRKEEAAGQLMSLSVEPKLDVFFTPVQYDQLFDNHGAGARPSEFLWRRGPGEDATMYLRWYAWKKLTVTLATKTEHMVKLCTVKLPEEADVDYEKSKIEVAFPCFLGSDATAELMADFARVSLKVRGEVTPSDHLKLLELFRREELLVSIYQRQGDLTDTAQPTLRPDAGKVVTADTPPSGLPTDDKLYPKLVTFLESERGIHKAAFEAGIENSAEAFVTIPEASKKLRVGANRAMDLLNAAVRAGLLIAKTDAGEYHFAPTQDTTDAAPATAAATDQESTPQSGGLSNPKCVQEWDEDAGQWIGHDGKPLDPQPKPPEFVNVRDLKPRDEQSDADNGLE